MELPKYTVTPCANGGITLTMSERTARALRRLIRMEDLDGEDETVLDEIAAAIERTFTA